MEQAGRDSGGVSQEESARASRSWWDSDAAAYLAEHGDFLGRDDLVWGPEGWCEAELGLLGPVADRDILEIGAGAAQGGRWCARNGARVVSTDISGGMLRHATAPMPGHVPLPTLAQCDAAALPFADEAFDVVFTAYGALPFVADAAAVTTEAARVLRPRGRFVFSVTHPIRWAFPDDPGPGGLTARTSYFDRSPYVERNDHGAVTYVEHHRTLGDRVRDIVRAGLVLVDLLEPEWPTHNTRTWGGWSPLRGRLLPGTAIFVARKP